MLLISDCLFTGIVLTGVIQYTVAIKESYENQLSSN
jgi:hypothetical protein